MIDLGTIAGLHAHSHELLAYCLRCDRWQRLELERLVRSGDGARRLPITVRCRRCGERGLLQVRPPMPAWSHSNGWMQSATDVRPPDPASARRPPAPA